VILSEAYRRQVNLRKHGTHNEPRELELYYWSLTVDALTSLLHSIEHVRLRVPLHVGCNAYFTRLTKLKSLDWDGRSYWVFGCSSAEGNSKVDKLEVEKVLERAFERFMEKPLVHIIGKF